MKDQSWFDLMAVLLAAGVVVFGAVSVLAVVPPPTVPGPTGVGAAGPTTYVNLSIALDPATGDFAYTSTALSVPLNTKVVFTIVNYDPHAATLPVASDAWVSGTMGGTMTILSAPGDPGVDGLSASEVAHTFSVPSPYYKLNVPIPVASPNGTPARVSFSVDFTVPGTFNWGCVVLCGGPEMSDRGMFGTLTAT